MPLFATCAELECCECGETTASAEALQRHISVQHMKWTPWHCPHCSAFAASESLMIKHLRNSHANLDHWIKYCPDPNMAKSLASALYKSMQMSAVASKNLSASAAAKSNRQNLSLNNRADCNICHLSVLRSNMTAHIASEHIRQPLYLCSMTECSGKRFFSSDSAKLHARKSHHRHDVIRNARLVSRSQLDKWRRRCFSDDPTHIECRRCGRIEHSSLQKHVKSFHMKSALFRCPQCTHSSKWSENVRRHQLTVHKSRKPDPVRLANNENEFRRLFADCKPRSADERKKSTVKGIAAAKRTSVAAPNKVSVADENSSSEKKRARSLPASTLQLTDSLSPVECGACGTMCANRVDFDKHVLLTHWTRALYRCPFCSYRVKSHEQTDRHIKLAHADRDYVEPKALDEDQQSLEQYSHALLNTSWSRFCRVCNRTVADRSMLLHVVDDHMEQALFKCALCAFSTKLRDDADSHASQHDQKPPSVFIPSAGRVFCQLFADCTGQMLAPSWWRT